MFSYDGLHATEPLAIISASAALALSGLSWHWPTHTHCYSRLGGASKGVYACRKYIAPRIPSSLLSLLHALRKSSSTYRCATCFADIPASRVVAGVRVGLLPELGFVVNPSIEQMEASILDLTIAGAASASVQPPCLNPASVVGNLAVVPLSRMSQHFASNV